MLAPKQRIPFKDKDNDWKESNTLYWYSKCYPRNGYYETLFKAANGELEQTDYSYMLNPYGDNIKNRENLKSYPAKLKNYPIIPSIIQLLMAEKRQSPLISLVGVTNPDSLNLKKQAEYMAIKQNIQQVYINTLNKMGVKTGQDSQPVPELEAVLKGLGQNWNDFRAIMGQDVLDFILDDCDIPRQFKTGYMYWLVTGAVASIKDVRSEDVFYKIMNPKNIGYIADETVDFLEDAEAVMTVTRMTRANFIDNYLEIIIKETKKKQEEIYEFLDNKGLNMSEPYVTVFGESENIYRQETSYNQNISYGYDGLNAYNDLADTIEVAYINWTSQEFVRVVGFTNDLGEVEELEVPEDYKIESEYGEFLIEEFWRNQKWEGYIVNGKKVTFGVQPIPFQRNKINRKSSCKNLINGRVRRLGNRKALSPVELILPYQHLHNILRYKINLVLSKNKEKLMIMPLQLIPNQEGHDMFSFMYHADASGIAWVDASKPEVINALNAIKAIDLSMGNYLQTLFELCDRTKAEAEEVLGINPQRKAQIVGKAGLGVTDNAIAQSQLMTLDLLEEYEEFEERELNGCLDLSKFAYINGKKASYINSEGRQIYINIDAENQHYTNAEFGVRVKSSAKEKNKLEKMKGFAETLASQKTSPSVLGHILNAEDNFEKLLQKLEEVEAEEKALLQQQQQADRDLQDAISKRAEDTADKDRALKYYDIDSKNENRLEVKQLDNAGKQNTMDSDNNNIPDFIDIQTSMIANQGIIDKAKNEAKKVDLDFTKHLHIEKESKEKLSIEKEKVSVAKEKLKVDRENMQNDLEIARVNAKNRSSKS